jgi:hypothetical protein
MSEKCNKHHDHWHRGCKACEAEATWADFRKVKDDRDQWRAVADSLAQELTDNLAPSLPSTGLADYEKLKSGSK